MQRWSTKKVGHPVNDDSRVLATVPNLVSIHTDPTSPEKADAEADASANEHGKSTTYQGDYLALVTLIMLLMYRDGCRTE